MKMFKKMMALLMVIAMVGAVNCIAFADEEQTQAAETAATPAPVKTEQPVKATEAPKAEATPQATQAPEPTAAPAQPETTATPAATEQPAETAGQTETAADEAPQTGETAAPADEDEEEALPDAEAIEGDTEEQQPDEELVEDEMTEEAAAEEAIPDLSNVTVTIRCLNGENLHIGDTVTLAATIEGAEGLDFAIQWQYNDGSDWHDQNDACDTTLTYTLNETNAHYAWRVALTIA